MTNISKVKTDGQNQPSLNSFYVAYDKHGILFMITKYADDFFGTLWSASQQKVHIEQVDLFMIL